MDITLSDLLPNANTGLSKIGFFFGAGSSFAAGYPLTSQLTIDANLSPLIGTMQKRMPTLTRTATNPNPLAVMFKPACGHVTATS